MLHATLLLSTTTLVLPTHPVRLRAGQCGRASVVLSGDVLATDEDKAIYALGHNIASQIPQLKGLSAAEVDTFVSGVRANLAGEQSLVDLSKYVPMATVLLQGRERQIAKRISAQGSRALAAALEEPGAVSTPGGAVLLTESEGSGAKPSEDDTVVVHYEGRLVDGTVFDSSYQRGEPLEFALNGVIQGWTEGLQMMAPGSKAKLTIPPALGYGAMGAPPRIPGEATLIFDIELLSVKGTASAPDVS
jgi:FKBP-type peptidyl-prolyl cis-trans isomerase FkpA